MEACWQIAVVDDIEKTVGSLLGLHLTKVDCLRGQLDTVAISFAPTTEFYLVSTECAHFEQAVALNSSELWRVIDSYFCDVAGGELSMRVVNLDGVIFTVIVYFFDCVACRNERRVLKIEDLTCCLAYEQVFEIESQRVKRHERVLSNGAQLEDFAHLIAIGDDLHNYGGNDDLCLARLERNCDLFLLLGCQGA